MTQSVEIVEVGPRDGLQSEPRQIATADKITLVDLLGDVGLRRIECASFVAPRWVPQMADSDAVLAGIARMPGLAYMALVPNLTGLARAQAAGVDQVAVFASATEGFSQANLNASLAEVLARLAPVVEEARGQGLWVRGYVSCVTDCPFEGRVAPDQVARAVAGLRALGCDEISLGETLGRATPEATDAMLRAVLQEVPAAMLAGHFHDTGGRALDNIEVALEHGLRCFDASVGGLGGCPYAPGAAGNVATEAVAARLAALGYETGLDLRALDKAASFARALRPVRHTNPQEAP